MRKPKRLTLLEKKEKLIKKLTPILERFTNDTGLIVVKIETEPDTEVMYHKELEHPEGVKLTYKLNMEIQL